ncbi:hypothetical protein DPMN_049093 [Dreissena polymorpha]|uniref:Uncharacterized protein n=1 Tax=Dreissena polymorpha TaxID=45954 RepID=A0A9D4DBX6_DREPO|nr:hypothetical protein DPMN_049093 [Dreissena polymorpha]
MLPERRHQLKCDFRTITEGLMVSGKRKRRNPVTSTVTSPPSLAGIDICSDQRIKHCQRPNIRTYARQYSED